MPADMQATEFTSRFEILPQPLGVGASGPVLQCVERTTGKRYACKFLKDLENAADELRIHTFSAATAPEGVVGVVDTYYRQQVDLPDEKDAHQVYHVLVLELMLHGDLFTWVTENGALSERDALEITLSAARTLAALHEEGIAHRDVKPENMMPQPSDRGGWVVKLTDFGFAAHGKTPTTPLGTGYYVAPEILKAAEAKKKMSETRAYTHACDMWSLGVCLYILLSAAAPFQPKSKTVQLDGHMKASIMEGKWDFRLPCWTTISGFTKNLITDLLVVEPTKRLTADGLVRRLVTHMADDKAALACSGLRVAIDTPAAR